MTPASERPGPRYRRLSAAVAAILVGGLAINGCGSDGPGARGLPSGERLPPFAVPLALSNLTGDANVATAADQGQAGQRPACSVRGPRILNICQLAERGPVVLAFLASRGDACADTVDLLDAARARHRGVQFAAVGIRGDREGLRELVRARRWSFPVGHDRDGILASLYGIAVCPQITYARWRGRTVATTHGRIDRRELERRIQVAVAASRRAGWEPPG